MAIKTIDVYSYGFEQGTVDGSGAPIASTTRVRSSAYIPLPTTFVDRKITISATVSTGKTIQVALDGYVTDSPPNTCDIGWYNSPGTFNLSSYSTTAYFKIILKYSDTSDITPSEITSCKATYDDGIVYHAHEGDYPINDSAFPIIQTDFTRPFPSNLWRIDQSNDGYPYTDLQLGILTYEPPHPPPPPPGPTGVPTVQPIATTEITDQTSIQWKRYTVGYTNPDLFRFRDGDLPENTKCDVFIKGTNSYRYTEERDHIDGSQHTETP